MAEPERRPRAPRLALAALRYRDFRLLILSTGTLQLGIWSTLVTSGWMVYHLSDSSFQVGLFSFVSSILILITTPLSGYLSDRGKRRLIMIGTQSILIGASLILAVLVTTDAIRLWHFFVLGPIYGGSFSMSGPTRMALVHDVVGGKELASAVTLNSITTNVMRVIGPAIGGTLIGFGPEYAFWFPLVAYTVALWPLLLLPLGGARQGTGQNNVFTSLKETIGYLRREGTIGPLIALAFVTGIFGTASLQLLPVYADRVLGSSDGTMLGWLHSSLGFGALLGAVAMSLFGQVKRRGRMFLITVAVYGGMLALLGFTGAFALAVLIMAALGVLTAMMLITNNILIQSHVAGHIRGRVLSIYFLSFSFTNIGAILNGTLAEWFALKTTFLTVGCLVTACAAFVALRSRAVREM
ncbi:MAG: MFS transporter [Chloroflexi bacterium]|nr:MFS transporter [Chloroflexota bacterium]